MLIFSLKKCQSSLSTIRTRWADFITGSPFSFTADYKQAVHSYIWQPLLCLLMDKRTLPWTEKEALTRRRNADIRVGEDGERIGLAEVQTTSFNGRPIITHTYKDNGHEDMLQWQIGIWGYSTDSRQKYYTVKLIFTSNCKSCCEHNGFSNSNRVCLHGWCGDTTPIKGTYFLAIFITTTRIDDRMRLGNHSGCDKNKKEESSDALIVITCVYS